MGRVSNVDSLAGELGCKVGSLPTTYPGLPLGAHCKSVVVWDGVEERFRKRLTYWKRQYISKGGRITLIKSTLSRMPLYLMSLLPLPRKVKLRLDKVQRDFLWGGESLERKPHLVKWVTICSKRRNRGLGVKNLSILNNALLSEWSWRYAREKDAWSVEVIRRKYGEEEGGWSSCFPRKSYGVGLWKSLSRWSVLVSNHFSFVVGDGKRTKFWKESWCGDTSLIDAYPSLFTIACVKNAWVGDGWSEEMGGGFWNPTFLIPFNDWEMDAVESLLCRIGGRRVIEGVEDRVQKWFVFC